MTIFWISLMVANVGFANVEENPLRVWSALIALTIGSAMAGVWLAPYISF